MIRNAVFLIALLAALPAEASTFNPADPTTSGYSLVFNSDFSVDTIATVDVNNTQAPGYNWYVKKFAAGGSHTSGPSNLTVSGGALQFSPPVGDTSNWQVATAAPGTAPLTYVGQAFANGWYIEANIQYLTANVQQGVAFWAENLTWLRCPNSGCYGRQWDGQSGNYDHWVEDDIMEWYNPTFTSTTFNSGLLDWYNSSSHVGLTMDPNTVTAVGDASFHKFGQLWIPGKPSNGFQGSIQTYFDGVATGTRLTWTDPVPPNQMAYRYPAPPPSGAGLGSWMDSQNMVIIIGGQGPFQVGYVKVWQAPLCP